MDRLAIPRMDPDLERAGDEDSDEYGWACCAKEERVSSIAAMRAVSHTDLASSCSCTMWTGGINREDLVSAQMR